MIRCPGLITLISSLAIFPDGVQAVHYCSQGIEQQEKTVDQNDNAADRLPEIVQQHRVQTKGHIYHWGFVLGLIHERDAFVPGNSLS